MNTVATYKKTGQAEDMDAFLLRNENEVPFQERVFPLNVKN